jgi:hypothetical protein
VEREHLQRQYDIIKRPPRDFIARCLQPRIYCSHARCRCRHSPCPAPPPSACTRPPRPRAWAGTPGYRRPGLRQQPTTPGPLVHAEPKISKFKSSKEFESSNIRKFGSLKIQKFESLSRRAGTGSLRTVLRLVHLDGLADGVGGGVADHVGGAGLPLVLHRAGGQSKRGTAGLRGWGREASLTLRHGHGMRYRHGCWPRAWMAGL